MSQRLAKSRLKFDVELTAEEVAVHFKHALEHLATTVKVSGFRPGKAPANLVKEQIDPSKLREEAYSLAVQSAWRKILEDLKELPIQDPEVDLVEFVEGKSAKLALEFDIRPEVKVGNYSKIKLPKIKGEEASDKEVEVLMNSLRRAHAKTVAKMAPASLGDKVHVDFGGSIKGVRKDKLTSKNFPLVLGHANTIPGFDQQLVGLKKGDKKTFTLHFPKDHFDKELAGQAVDFNAEIQEVFDVILPEIDTEFAKSFGHTKPEQLTKAMREDITRRKTEENFTLQKAKWLSEFEKLVKCELPKTLVEAEVDRSREAWQKFLTDRLLKQDQWLKDRGMTLEQLETDWTKAAQASVRIGLGLAEAAKAMKRELKSNEEFQGLLDELVKKAIDPALNS